MDSRRSAIIEIQIMVRKAAKAHEITSDMAAQHEESPWNRMKLLRETYFTWDFSLSLNDTHHVMAQRYGRSCGIQLGHVGNKLWFAIKHLELGREKT